MASIRSSAHRAFGDAIREVRAERGISQEGLALLCGLDRTYVGGIERGELNPSLTNVLKIAQALDVPASELHVRAERIIAHASKSSRQASRGVAG